MIGFNPGNVQRVYHYSGFRPIRAVITLAVGFILGWSVCAHQAPKIDRPIHAGIQYAPR